MMQPNISREDLEKKIKSYQNPKDFEEDELFLWHEMAGFLNELNYNFYLINHGLDEKINEAMQQVTRSRFEWHEFFGRDQEKRPAIINDYSQSIKNFFSALAEASKKLTPEQRQPIRVIAEDLLSFWNDYFGNQEDFDLGAQLQLNRKYFQQKMRELYKVEYASFSPKKVLTKGNYFMVVNTLIGNAIKYAFDEGSAKKLTVMVKEDNRKEQYLVSISDNGKGIPAGDLPFVFNKYFSSGKEEGHGLGRGLGLYFAKKMVEKNGGQISVKSKFGQGTTFIFTMPYERVK